MPIIFNIFNDAKIIANKESLRSKTCKTNNHETPENYFMAFHIICIIREQKSKSKFVYHQNYLSTWYMFENFKSLIVWVSLTAVLRELANPFISMLTQIIRNRTTNHESGNNECEQNGKSQQSCSYYLSLVYNQSGIGITLNFAESHSFWLRSQQWQRNLKQ